MTLTQILQKIRSAFYTKAETNNLLSGKSNTNHNHNSAYLGIKAKAESAKSADSVAWANVSGKPTIPTVNNATLTIQKNGTTVKTFTANASSNVTCNITVPTKISDLTNDSGFINDLSSYALDSNVVHKSGNETINDQKKFTSEIVSTSSHAFRHISGDYGVFWRHDGTALYLMITNRGDRYGGWNDFRPLTVNLDTGECNISGRANSAVYAERSMNNGAFYISGYQIYVG